MSELIADQESKRAKSFRDGAAFTSMLFVPVGAGFAWGFGGLMFGIGLWCLLVVVGGDIEAAIKEAHSR